MNRAEDGFVMAGAVAGQMRTPLLSGARIAQLLDDFGEIRALVAECIVSPSECREALICQQVREVSLPLCELSLVRVVEVLNSNAQCANEQGVSTSVERLSAYAEVVDDVICYIENLRDGFQVDDGFLENITDKMTRAGAPPERDAKPCLAACPDGMMMAVFDDVESSLKRIGGALERWQETPASRLLAREFQRQLHSLKGGILVYGITELVNNIQHLESCTAAFLKGELQGSATLFEMMSRYVSRSCVVLGLLRNEQSGCGTSAPGVAVVEMVPVRHGGVSSAGEAQLHDAEAELQPFSFKLPRLRFLVERASVMLGKPVRLLVKGEELAISRKLTAKLIAPLELLLWNAIDHGIESRKSREALGKPVDGVISLSLVFNRQASRAEITVADDGAGIDEAAVREKALATGYVSSPAAAARANLAEMVLYPGLSTAQPLSPVSGRGMGLDVVNTEIKRLGGSVQVNSMRGQGASFTLLVPL